MKYYEKLHQAIIDSDENLKKAAGESLLVEYIDTIVSTIYYSFKKFEKKYEEHLAIFLSLHEDATEKLYLKKLRIQYESLLTNISAIVGAKMCENQSWERECEDRTETEYIKHIFDSLSVKIPYTDEEEKFIMDTLYSVEKRSMEVTFQTDLSSSFSRIIEFIDNRLETIEVKGNTKQAQINVSDTKIVDTNYFKNFTIGQIDFILNRLISERILITTPEIFKAMLRNDKDVKGHVHWLMNSILNKPDQTALGEFFKNLQCPKGKSRPTLQKEIIYYWIVGGAKNELIKANFKTVTDGKMTENVAKVRAIFEELKNFTA